MNFKTYLNETQKIKTEWYHGDKSQRTNFHDQTMDRDPSISDANAQGPGIYFTNSFREATSYANPSGYVYKIEIKPVGIIINDKTKAKKDVIEKLIDWCPEERKQIGLSNWDEDPVKAKQIAIQQYLKCGTMDKATFGVYQDFYGFTEANEWANSMLNTGIDGFLHKVDGFLFEGIRHHLIIYNSKIITILEELTYEESVVKLGYEI